ncbi:MAG: DUF6252 family protein [Bacteroidota bacterium]
MKTIKLLSIFTLFFAALNLTSCATNDEPVDPAVLAGPAPATFTASFDGATFTATTVNAILSGDDLSITGVKSSGEFFQITIPQVALGTYKWANLGPTEAGFSLGYSAGSGAVPYIGARDDSGTFASFTNYTDTAEITVTSVDAVNKKISGTFRFTGVRYVASSVTTVETKEFTNGTFTNVSYGTPDVPVTPLPAGVALKLDGATYTPTSVSALQNSGMIGITAVRGTDAIGLNFPDTIVVGSYPFSSTSTYVGQYITGSSVFASSSGTLTITSHNTSTKKIMGTFSYTAAPFGGTGSNHQITQGTFNITYN